MSYEFVDHTSEVTVRLRAGSFPDLIAESGRALAELMLRDETPEREGEWREMTLSAPDRGALLVDWMNELIYRAEVEGWAPADVEVQAVGPLELRVRVRGVQLGRPFALAKAATLHDLSVRDTQEGVEAEVTLDV